MLKRGKRGLALFLGLLMLIVLPVTAISAAASDAPPPEEPVAEQPAETPVEPPAAPVEPTPPADPVEPPAEPVAPPADPVEPPADPVEPAAPAAPTADPVKPADAPAKLAAVTAQAMPTVVKDAPMGLLRAGQPPLEAFNLDIPTDSAYDGQPRTASVTAKPGGEVGDVTATEYRLGDDGTPTTSAPSAPGTYTVLVTGGAGTEYEAYTQLPVGTFTISKRELTVTPSSLTKTYDGEVTIDASAALSISGEVSGEDVNIVVTGGTLPDKNVGTGIVVALNAALSGNDADNYTLPDPLPEVTATVAAIELTVEEVPSYTLEKEGSVRKLLS